MQEMNFRVVENSPPSHLDRYDEFVEMYKDTDIKVEKIKAELGWSTNVYERARKQAIREGLITNRHPGRYTTKKEKSPPKHYSFNRNANKFIIKKWLRKGDVRKEYYYGAYGNEDAVKMIVAELKKVDWDVAQLDAIQDKVKRELGVLSL